MIPILFPSSETHFDTRGLGPLPDAVSCIVTEERNGGFELTMQYPVTGLHYAEITDRAVIVAIPSPYRPPQPFRVYQIEAPLNGIVTIHASHLSYDLSGIPVEPFSVTGDAQDIMDAMVSHSLVTNPFTLTSDFTTSRSFEAVLPTSCRGLLGGQEGSLLDHYHGEYLFDGYDVSLLTSRGVDSGVRIAYGKNMTEFKMTSGLNSIVTGIYPFWTDGDGNIVECSPKIVTVTAATYDNVLTVDLSDRFDEEPTPAQLLAEAQAYITENDLDTPRVTFDVSFVDLASTDEYAGIAQLEKVDLCDTVTVVFPLYGIEATAKVVAIETNVLADRYNKVTVGTLRTTLADTIARLSSSSPSMGGGGSSVDPYPVGSVVITNTNSNPSADFGGTWSLIDKEFTPTTATQISVGTGSSNDFALNSTNTTSMSAWVSRHGHSITLSVNAITFKVSVTGTNLTLGTFNLSNLGASEATVSPIIMGWSDGAHAIVGMNINRTSGVMQSQDVVVRGTGTSIAAGSSAVFTVELPCDYQYMTDSLCNKFFWRRTA